jgi:hypothetical protein
MRGQRTLRLTRPKEIPTAREAWTGLLRADQARLANPDDPAARAVAFDALDVWYDALFASNLSVEPA